jgi:hypothetical protein
MEARDNNHKHNSHNNYNDNDDEEDDIIDTDGDTLIQQRLRTANEEAGN